MCGQTTKPNAGVVSISSPALEEYYHGINGTPPIHHSMLNGLAPARGNVARRYPTDRLLELLRQAQTLNHAFPALPGPLRRMAKRQQRINELLFDASLGFLQLTPSTTNSRISKDTKPLQALNNVSRWVRKQARINRLLIQSIFEALESIRKPPPPPPHTHNRLKMRDS